MKNSADLHVRYGTCDWEIKYEALAMMLHSVQVILSAHGKAGFTLSKNHLSTFTTPTLRFHQITKRQVDTFVPGRRVPSCQLYVRWTGQQQGQPPQLDYRVELLGAKAPFNFFLVQPPSLSVPQPPSLLQG